MRAVLTVAGTEHGCPGGACLPLLPVLDRPFLQHVVEAVAARGVTDITFVLGPRADEVARALGSGRRWGCRFAWHLARTPFRPARPLRAAAAAGGPLLVGRTDSLPDLPADLPSHPPAAFDHDGVWTGWAVADPAAARAVPAAAGWDDLADRLAGDRRPVPGVLRLRTLADLPAAQRAALDGSFPGLLRTGREVRPGVWVGRGARVAATAALEPPVFIGEGSLVGAGAAVGPGAVVGADCLLDAGCAVRESTVLPASYVGPGVAVRGVLVNGRQLVHPARGTAVDVDPHLLDRLGPARPAGRAARLLARGLAGGLFLLALPVLAGAAAWLRVARPGPVLWPRRFDRHTAYVLAPPRPGTADHGWVIPPTPAGLLLELLPGLLAVARGRLRVVGLPPRSADQLRRFRPDRRPALAAAPAGLVTEAALSGRPGAPLDEVALTDVYQMHTAGVRADLGRLARFLARAVFGRPTPPTPGTGDTPVSLAALADTPLSAAPEPEPTRTDR